MLVFSPPQIVRDRSIYLPYYIRALLGFHAGQSLHLSLTKDESPVALNELLVSPIPVADRSDVWLLRAVLRDRPGLIAELSRHLADLSIDIISCRIQTSDHNNLLHVYLAFDARFYSSRFDLNTTDRSKAIEPALWELRARIASIFIEDLQFATSGKPHLSIRRNQPLFTSAVSPLEYREIVVITKNGTLEIPRNVFRTMESSFVEVYPSVSSLKGRRKWPIVCLTADLESSLFRALIYFRTTGHSHVRVTARNRPGALAAITGAIHHRGFNVLEMYTRNVGKNELAKTDMLLHLPPERDKERNDAKLKRFTKAIFRDSELKDLSITVEFPEPTLEAET